MVSGKEALRMVTQKAETRPLPASEWVSREKDFLKNPIFYSGYGVVSKIGDPELNKKANAVMAKVKKAAEDQMKKNDAEFNKKLKAEDDKKKSDSKPKADAKKKLTKSMAMKTSRAK